MERKQNGKLLNIFLLPAIRCCTALMIFYLHWLQQGVDMIEVGLPYSDPLADGQLIQETSKWLCKMECTLIYSLSSWTEIMKLSVPFLFI